MSRGCVCMRAGVAVILIVLILGIILALVPNVLRRTIIRETVLRNGSKLYKAWLSPPGEVYARFHLFSVLNPAEIVNGKRPVVQERGPYTYRENIIKSSVIFSPDNSSVSYRETRFYTYCPELSNGTESDKITILNLAYIAVAQQTTSAPKFVSFLINLIEKYYKEDLFVEKTVNEAIWGYEDPILKILNKVISVQTIVGLFVGKNGTDNGMNIINTGASEFEKLGQFISFHNQSKLSCWGSDSANAINGSDGSLIPCFRSVSDTIYVFAGDICRSFGLTVENFITIKGIPALTFSLPKETLLSPLVNPDNRGFCLDYPYCLKSGLLNMSTCLPGAPVVISMPHLYMADKSYQDMIIGLTPSPNMVTRLIIEPQTGIILQAQKMLQINGILHQDPQFTALKHIFKDPLFLPIGYINESFLIPDHLAGELRDNLVALIYSAKIISVYLIAFSSLSLFILFITFLFLPRSPSVSKKTIVPVRDEENDTTPLFISDVVI